MTRATAKATFAAELWLAAHGSSLVKVADLLSVTPPAYVRAMQDATTHDSAGGAEEVIPEGTYDPGEIKFQMLWVSGSANDLALIGFATGATYLDFKIVAKAASGTEDLTGSGYLADYTPADMPVKGKQVANGTIKVSGARSRAATP